MPELLERLQSALAERYRLEGEIGAGGMASVYLAHDLRHDRRVAVKVLRPELAAVIGAERFLAEIKLTANLQHPHILPLFDSGAADSFLFYVMPFVAGETLRARLNREKQLPVADALGIATEVASALDYAHRHQVIHRDIKPENILLHDGRALVADFGIALAASKASGSRMTETGMSLGTPQYMSPEQAMGEREVTARSDVYALGAVLYEMLTGDPPFSGSTAQAIVARVVTETPRPLLPQRHTIPPQVEVAVMTALEKLPADRFATAAEFAAALAERSPTAAVTMPATAAPRSSRRWQTPTLVASALAVLAAIAALWGWLRPMPDPPVGRFSLFLPESRALQRPGTSGSRLAISPEGRRLAYVGPGEAGPRLWLRRLDQLDATPISGTEGALSPFFSPDGRQIGFITRGTTIRVVSLEGGPPLTLTDSANTTGGDWGSDGYVYFEVDSGIARVRATGGPVEPVYTMSDARKEVGTEWPSVLPGASGLLFRVRRTADAPDDFDIMAMKLPAGEARVVTRGVFARYAVSGHLLVVTADGKLLAIPFDPKQLTLTGPPAALLEGIAVGNGGFGVDLVLSPAGTMAYTTGGAVASRRAVWVSRDGLATPVDPNWEPQGTLNSITLSPDGKALAVGLVRDGKEDIWVKQLPTGPFSRITFGDTSYLRPSWSSDGRSLIYLGDHRGLTTGLPYVRRADGTGKVRAIRVSASFNFGQVLESRDGKWLVLRRAGNEPGNGDIHAARVGDSALVPLVTSNATEGEPALSPDGRWLAYISDESGAFEVYVRPFPEVTSARWQVSTTGGGEPIWANSGRELYYRNGRNELVAAEIRAGSSFSVGEQRVLFSVTPYLDLGFMQSYNVSPDDRRFLMVREGAPSQVSELILTQNWLQELKVRTRR